MARLMPLLLVLPFLATSACAQDSRPKMSKDEIRKIVREYLLEEPELIRDALLELDRREEAEAMAALAPQLYNDSRDPSIGPKNAKVTIVEFFDYNCGYCKSSTDWVRGTIDKYPDDVRIIFKELPLLDRRTKTSRNAALAALAAARQGKYSEMHFAMMNESNLAPERVEALAKKAGLDVEMLKKDMKDDKLAEQVEDSFDLARRIPELNGTPFFIINDTFVAGADVDRLETLLDAALKG
ncbi:DsbA family protein [Robiginitomaculum antarcticum]|uniref:DsbA family protein n=1 Tax=Robiginitomaculum antarcticum TaxID=437507 RepID=UPI00036FC5D4|nr:thioredoxin domain-containing protein [Robiginitomaculum antarcticum]